MILGIVAGMAAMVVSALTCYWLVRYAHVHLAITGDRPHGFPERRGRRPQKVHTRMVPRVGGLGLMAGMATSVFLAFAFKFPDAANSSLMLFFCSIPAFLGGLADDLTGRVGAMPRLLLAMASGAMAFVLLDAHLYRSQMAWLDAALAYWPVSFAATLFAVAGVAHALNLVDGYNGLAGGSAVLILGALAAVALKCGAQGLAFASLAFAAAACGFLLLNYPGGRIFLGDGGAYVLGAVIAIVSAVLVGEYRTVSPWFPFALVVYPVWETLFSIFRRAALHRTSIGSPDARHLHSLIYRRVLRQVYPAHDEASRAARNAWTAVPLWLVQAVMVVAAVKWYDGTRLLQIQSVAFITAYCLAYYWLSRFRRVVPPGIADYLRRRARRREGVSGPQDGLAGGSGSIRGGLTR